MQEDEQKARLLEESISRWVGPRQPRRARWDPPAGPCAWVEGALWGGASHPGSGKRGVLPV